MSGAALSRIASDFGMCVDVCVYSEAKHDQIMKNEEIQNIKKILGLQHNKEYKDIGSLRYGSIMIMTDQVCLHTTLRAESQTDVSYRIMTALILRDSF